jgi:hypothetical protein
MQGAEEPPCRDVSLGTMIRACSHEASGYATAVRGSRIHDPLSKAAGEGGDIDAEPRVVRVLM